MTRKAVPWRTDKCSKAVRDRNKAFKLLKRRHNYNHLVLFKKAQAVVRRTIRQAKRGSWIMIKRMEGNKKEWEYPVLESEGEIALMVKDKAEMLVKTFAQIHGSENVSEEEKRKRELTEMKYRSIDKDWGNGRPANLLPIQ